MHPAFSVIFLTTLIGAGQGLFLALYTIDVACRYGVIGELPDLHFFVAGTVLAALLAAFGLFASFFHLGRPERAWRSAAKWRTSWLSREVIALPVFIAGVLVYGTAHHLGWPLLPIIGASTLVACLALFVCTGMVYACIKFLQEWASPLTVINFFLLGVASGFMLAAPLAAMLAPALTSFYAVSAIALTAAAFVFRAASLARNARLKPKSSLQTAIGIKHNRIVQISQGFMGGSFNTREFFHGASRAAVRSAKWGFLVLAFPLPILLVGIGLAAGSTIALVLAFAVQYLGLIAERWFFFAQANHPQNLYYQTIA